MVDYRPMVDNIDPVASLQKYISTNKQLNEKFILLNFEFVVINLNFARISPGGWEAIWQNNVQNIT